MRLSAMRLNAMRLSAMRLSVMCFVCGGVTEVVLACYPRHSSINYYFIQLRAQISSALACTRVVIYTSYNCNL